MIDKVKREFISIWNTYVKREGSKELLSYIMGTDFFRAPASSQYHSNFEGGLCYHSINVYRRLKQLVEMEGDISKKVSDESIAIIGLLHDLCKANFYVPYYRNVKEDGVWIQKLSYKIDESYPFGHGEKSVYLIQKYMKLTDEEAMAINWHMGAFDSRTIGGSQAMNQAFHKYPLAFLTHVADSMATYIDEDQNPNEDY
ncbi:MAG: HD domain-containing protein [Gammaproteobacteria bacterium]|nr:HD domain-containing protein [Gammaproteobacteria bacterium]